MSAPLHRFRVYLTTWDSWLVVLNAESEQAAKVEAERLYYEIGDEEFKHKGCGLDSIEAEHVGPADGDDQ